MTTKTFNLQTKCVKIKVQVVLNQQDGDVILHGSKQVSQTFVTAPTNHRTSRRYQVSHFTCTIAAI